MIFTFTSLIASGQLNLELGIKAQKYEGTISTEGSSHIHLGYQWHEKWSAGVEYMYSSARFDIRMKDTKVPTINWGGVLVNVLTVSNSADWTSTKTRKVFKGYNRNMYTYRAKLFFHSSKVFKMYIGPTIRHNVIYTESSDELTYSNRPLSDLEFEPYQTYGFVIGADLKIPVSARSYIKLGVDIQNDVKSNSNIITDSKFMGKAFAYGFGIGFNLGSRKDNSQRQY